MDILVYDYILQGLKDYNSKVEDNYENSIYSTYPKLNKNQNISFPITIVEETRNVSNPNFNSRFERVANVGYSVNIFAKSKGKIQKEIIARRVAQIVDNYMTNIGLLRVSYNVNDLENDGAISRIIITYSGNLHENRRTLI